VPSLFARDLGVYQAQSAQELLTSAHVGAQSLRARLIKHSEERLRIRACSASERKPTRETVENSFWCVINTPFQRGVTPGHSKRNCFQQFLAPTSDRHLYALAPRPATSLLMPLQAVDM
jgi:hypothetical protein